MKAALLSLAALLATAVAHPSASLRKAGVTCDQAVGGAETIKYYSYHIHVLYWYQHNASVTEAMRLKQKFISTFNIDPTAACDDGESTHGVNPALCIVDNDTTPTCPFVTSEWAAFVPPENISALIPFFTQNRGSLDVLVHPNSGCEVWDHLTWPLWSGNKWELDGSCLHYNCPGCDYTDCATRGAALVPATPEATQCHKDVCSAQCTSWLTAMKSFNEDCPNYCDAHSEFCRTMAAYPGYVTANAQCHA